MLGWVAIEGQACTTEDTSQCIEAVSLFPPVSMIRLFNLSQDLVDDFDDMPSTSSQAGGAQCALSGSSFTRVNVITQFTSQVLPPSSENACSKRLESGVMSEKLFRT